MMKEANDIFRESYNRIQFGGTPENSDLNEMMNEYKRSKKIEEIEEIRLFAEAVHNC